MTQLPQRPIHQKHKPWRCETYRKHVASLPCMACGAVGISNAAHIGITGLSMKNDDFYCIPLCSTRSEILGCHATFDKNQQRFAAFHFELTIDELKDSAREAYDEWKAKQ